MHIFSDIYGVFGEGVQYREEKLQKVEIAIKGVVTGGGQKVKTSQKRRNLGATSPFLSLYMTILHLDITLRHLAMAAILLPLPL